MKKDNILIFVEEVMNLFTNWLSFNENKKEVCPVHVYTIEK